MSPLASGAKPPSVSVRDAGTCSQQFWIPVTHSRTSVIGTTAGLVSEDTVSCFLEPIVGRMKGGSPASSCGPVLNSNGQGRSPAKMMKGWSFPCKG